MRKSICFLGSFLLIILSAHIVCAKPLLTVTCESPKGKRVDYGEELFSKDKERKLELNDDSYTGITPVFIVDFASGTKMVVLWGGTRTKGIPDEFFPPPEAVEADIVHLTLEQISAVENRKNGMWVYTLYPKLNFGIFTRQIHDLVGNHATGSVFYAKCKFAVSE